MFIPILLTSVMKYTLLTVLIIVALIFFFVVERKLMNKYEAKLKRWFVSLIYFSSFIVLFAALFLILTIWNYDIIAFFDQVVDNFNSNIEVHMARLISSTVIIFISLIILRIIKMTLKYLSEKGETDNKRKKTIVKIANSITKYLIWIITGLIVLAIWGVNVGPALAGLGIAGLVIGLGAQKFINDLISGIFIVFERHFDVGDIIEVQGFKGEVIDIGLKTTRIRNWKGDVKVVANGEISSVINYTEYFSVAVVEFAISYKSDLKKTIDIINEKLPIAMASFEEILIKPTVAGVTDLSNNSIGLRVTARTVQEKQHGIEREMRKQIKFILDENGIEFPFPQIVVHQSK